MSAADALAQMAAVYASCSSYVDNGEVVQAGRVRPFTTTFVRPSKLRFSYRERMPGRATWDQSLIWWTGDDAHSYASWMGDEFERKELVSAIAAFTGVSGGSAHTIPRLLLPATIGGWALDDLHDAVAVDDSLDVARCIRVTGFHPWSPTKVELWIDAETHLLRQVRRTPAKDGIDEATTTYHPRINLDDVSKLFDMTKESLVAEA